LNAGYVEADGSVKEHCGIFERAMRAGPMKHMQEMSNKYGNFSDIAEGMGLGSAFGGGNKKPEGDATEEEKPPGAPTHSTEPTDGTEEI
jgi:hypothetical protein